MFAGQTSPIESGAMGKEASKKRRRKAPNEKKPTAVLRFDPDIGVTYVKLIVRYRDRVAKRSDLKDQMDMFASMGGVEHESSNVGSEIEQLDQEIHQLKLSLVDVGGRLKQESYEADIDTDLIKRAELRGWLDLSLDEDLCMRLDEWRCARKRKQAGSAQETTEVATTKRDDEHAALVVDAGKFQITYDGHTCDFKASNMFELMKNLARRPGVPILAEDKAVVSRLRTRLRKVEALTPIAKAIVSKRDRLYMLDPDTIGGVKLIEAPELG